MKPTAPAWLEELADLAEQLLRNANRGEWPTTLRQLRHVAADLAGCHVEILPSGPVPALHLDTVIVAVDCHDDPRTSARILHEIIERTLKREEYAHFRSPIPDATVPHQVARLLEQRYLRYMRYVEAARRDAHSRRQESRARPLLPDLTREWDEWAEPQAPARRRRRR